MDFAVFGRIGRVVLCMVPVMVMSSPTGAASHGLDPCTLLTTAEVE